MVCASSRSNDAQFTHKLYVSLHAINRQLKVYSPHNIKTLKDFNDNTNRAWFLSLKTIIR